jgi:nicotinamide riboside kinase
MNHTGALCIAIVGAECTGKTTLARELAGRLAQGQAGQAAPGGSGAPRVAWVPEWLREWCDRHGRTPHIDEQAAIAAVQHERIRAAAATHDVVICDTTALMTAVYSRIVFGDRSLDAAAVALHRELHGTLLTAIDLPWRSDGLQRDGPHVREPVDDALRELLHTHGLPYAVVAGRGDERLARALAAVEAAATAPATTRPAAARRLFTGLDADAGGTAEEPARRWVCDCCVPEAEHALRRR